MSIQTISLPCKQKPLLHAVQSGSIKYEEMFIVLMASLARFFSHLSAKIYFLTLSFLARDLNVYNKLINPASTSSMVDSDVLYASLHLTSLAPAFIGDVDLLILFALLSTLWPTLDLLVKIALLHHSFYVVIRVLGVVVPSLCLLV